MSLSLRILWGVTSWLLFWAFILTPLMALGWILVPLAVLLRAYEKTGTQYNQLGATYDHYRFTWGWLDAIYGNWEDGCCAGWQYSNWGSIPMQIIFWSALRNPVNGLRTTPILSFILDKQKVRYIGSFGDEVHRYDSKEPQWYFAWHGVYSCIFVVKSFPLFGLRRIFIGWKIYPSDIFGVTGYRRRGVGFALQFRPLG